MISGHDEVIPNPKSRRLVLTDIKAIARLVATRRMTENDACITLGIKPSQWQVFKTRNKRSDLFENLIARVRGHQTDHLVSIIEKAGNDYDIELPNGKVITKRGDWRAPAWLLEKTAPQFAPKAESATPVVTVQIGIIHEQLKKVIGFASNEPTKPLEPSLLPDSVTIADDQSKSLISNPTHKSKIKIPTRRA